MRKFFKSLAVLLALTLIVGVIPAAAADSLSMQKEKILYLGGSQGTKEDGTKCKTGAKKLVANMIKGFDKDTMSVVLSSADKDIVKTTKAGRIVAKSLGTTTVTVTVYDASEKEIFKQDLKVKVKKNATDVTVTGIADGDNFKVGQSVDVTLPRAGVDTDEREFTVDKADLVELKAGEKARTYTVKFLKAGELTFTAKAFQSTKYPATTVKKDIKVTVSNPVPTDVKVVASEAFELSFDTDVEAAGLFKDPKDIATDAIYYMINDTKVTFSAVKAVKATGKTVKVTMYDTFKAGETYYVDINGSKDLKFALSGNGAKDVKEIVITTTTAEVKEDASATEIKYVLYNADGIDITTTAMADANASVNIVAADGTLNAYVSAGTITMYTVGDVADVVATYKYYDPNNNYAETTLSATQKITAIAPAAYAYSGFVYTIDATSATRVLKNDESNLKHYVALGDEDINTGVSFQAVLKYTKNGQTDKFQVGVDNFNGKPLFVKVAEESVAIIGTQTGAKFEIIPNSVGTTNVFIGTTDNDTASGKMTIIAVAPIEVKAKRYAQSLTVTTSQSTLNPANGNDVLTLTAVVKDQYGDNLAVGAGALASEQLKQSQDKRRVDIGAWANAADGTPGKYEAKVGGVNGTIYDDVDGAAKNDTVRNIVLTTKVNNGTYESKANTVTNNFSVKNIAASAKDVIEFKTDKTAFDTALTKETNVQKANITLRAYNGGYFTQKTDFSGGYDKITNKQTGASAHIGYYLVKNGETPAAGAVSGSGFALEILKDGTRIDQNGANGGFTFNGNNYTYDQFIDLTSAATGEIVVKGMIIDAGNRVAKLASGTYTFRMYVITNGKIAVKTLNLSVTDKQIAPAFEQKYQSRTEAANAGKNVFKFTFNGEGGAYNGDATGPVANAALDINANSGNTNKDFVKGATVTLNITLKDGGVNTPGTFNTYVSINKLIDP